MASSRPMAAVPIVHISAVEAAGMKPLMAGQLPAYDIGTARDGRSKAINLRLLNPEHSGREQTEQPHLRRRGRPRQ